MKDWNRPEEDEGVVVPATGAVICAVSVFRSITNKAATAVVLADAGRGS